MGILQHKHTESRSGYGDRCSIACSMRSSSAAQPPESLRLRTGTACEAANSSSNICNFQEASTICCIALPTLPQLKPEVPGSSRGNFSSAWPPPLFLSQTEAAAQNSKPFCLLPCFSADRGYCCCVVLDQEPQQPSSAAAAAMKHFSTL